MKKTHLWIIAQILYSTCFGIAGIGEGITTGKTRSGDFILGLSFVIFAIILFSISFFFGMKAAGYRIPGCEG